MTLTKEMQKKVEENMGLVGKVISDKIRTFILMTICFKSAVSVYARQLTVIAAGLSLHMRIDLSGMKFATRCAME